MEISENRLIVKQKVEMLEAFTGFETKNRYQIWKNNDKTRNSEWRSSKHSTRV